MAMVVSDYPRLLLWASLGAAISMAIYAMTSDQRAIEAAKKGAAALRSRLLDDAGDLEVSTDYQQIRALLALSFKQFWLVLKPSLLASVPLIALLTWISNSFGYVTPPAGSVVQGRVLAAHTSGDAPRIGAYRRMLFLWPVGDSTATLTDNRGAAVAEIDPGSAVPVIHKRLWWNLFIGNPLGYLPDDSDFERVEFELRPRRFFDGPADWMGGWELSFFTVMIVVSLAIKFVFRLR